MVLSVVHNIKQQNGYKQGWTFIHPIVRAYYPWINGIIASRMFTVKVPTQGIEGKRMEGPITTTSNNGISAKLVR